MLAASSFEISAASAAVCTDTCLSNSLSANSMLHPCTEQYPAREGCMATWAVNGLPVVQGLDITPYYRWHS